LETKILKYAPDIVLIGFCAENDFKYSKGRQHKTDKIKRKKSKGFYASVLYRFVRAHVKSREEKSPSAAIQKKHDDFIQDAFAHISRFSKEHSIPIAIAYLSTLYQKDDSIRLRVAQLANLNQLKFVDASILFKDTDRRDYTLNFLNAHPNKEANQLFAKSILDSLDFRVMLPENEINY
jgi:lysophospholipase L1-like esterase